MCPGIRQVDRSAGWEEEGKRERGKETGRREWGAEVREAGTGIEDKVKLCRLQRQDQTLQAAETRSNSAGCRFGRV